MRPNASAGSWQRIKSWLGETKSWVSDIRVFSLETVVVLGLILVFSVLVTGAVRRLAQRGTYTIAPTEMSEEVRNFGLTPELLQSKLIQALRKVTAEAASMSWATVQAEMVLGETDRSRGGSIVKAADPSSPSIEVKIPTTDLSLGLVDALVERVFGTFETPIRSALVCMAGNCATGRFNFIISIGASQSEAFALDVNRGVIELDEAALWILHITDPYLLAAWEMAHDKPEAERHALEAAYYSPNRRAHAWALIGNMRFKAGDLDSADKYYRKALEYDSEDIVALAGMVSLLKVQAENEKRLQPLYFFNYQSIIGVIQVLISNISPMSVDESRSAGYSTVAPLDESRDRQKKMMVNAVLIYKLISILAPKKAAVQNNLGERLSAVGELANALERYERALELNPFDDRVLGNKARVLLKLRRGREARDAYAMALSLSPQNRKYETGINCVAKLDRIDWRTALRMDQNSLARWVDDCTGG